jgi:hypothetical protein
MRDALKPVWASLGTPLRVRFDHDGPVCFARSYDAAHLARSPHQSVRRIAILKAAGARPEDATWPRYELTFRVELTDGRKIEKKADCTPDDYAYRCTVPAGNDTERSFTLTRAGDGYVMLRDGHDALGALFGARLGSDDRIFRMQALAPAACAF